MDKVEIGGNIAIEKNKKHETLGSHTCLFHKLEDTARQMPEKDALIFGSSAISYSQLNKLANALAIRLIELNVAIEDFVIVNLDRSFELVISIFGILKAGGVYVPVTKDIPPARFNSIIEDCSPRVIITTKAQSETIPANTPVIFVDDFIEKNINSDIENLQIDVQPNNLAYCIFTSGTTGKPKGVLIEHHSVINRLEWMQKEFPITEKDVLLQKTSITFDVSIWELFWWSFVGAKLVLLEPGAEREPIKMLRTIENNKVSVIHFVPSMFNTFLKTVDADHTVNQIKSLRYIFCSGEALHASQVTGFYELNSKLKNQTTLVNLYGPTEATVDVTYFICKHDGAETIPIGKPIDNTEIYIIDKSDAVLSKSQTGELVICGVNLARGYLNSEELTNEKFFLLNVDEEIKRAYRTGDEAYFDETGEIIYKGRIDTQVKLRGFRIELTEIENTLLSHPDVCECTCIVKDEGQENAHIVAFVVSSSNIELKQYVSQFLPDYMVPAKIVNVEQVPVTSSGKADRKQLATVLDIPVKEQSDGQKKSGAEQKLLQIWGRLLRTKKVNIDSNFFDLGGNSLLLVQMALLIKKEFNKDVDVITIMEYPTIKMLAKYLA